MHSHDCVLGSFLLSGAIVEVDERNQRVECGSYTLHATPPGLRHAHLIQTPRVSTLCFRLDESLLSPLGPQARVFDEPITSRNGNVVSLAPKIRRELSATDSASDLVLHGLVLELIGELARRGDMKLGNEAPPWLKRARQMLHETWNQNISVEQVAAEVGVHPSHLTRVFRAHLKQTPGEYLRRIRLERATRQVLASDLPLKAIAAYAGFADQAHFTREFRKHHGLSPMEMRRLRSGRAMFAEEPV